MPLIIRPRIADGTHQESSMEALEDLVALELVV